MWGRDEEGGGEMRRQAEIIWCRCAIRSGSVMDGADGEQSVQVR